METQNNFGLPQHKLFFTLTEIKEMGFLSVERAKKLLYSGDLHGVKNGVKWIIPKEELLRILNANFSGNRGTK